VRNVFDVIVVGGGHAGCEAAAAACRCGSRVALVTLDPCQIGRLSCNPAIGGLAKGHLVREIDALGGLMGVVADATSIQFRRLNTRRGLAVQSSRAQVDIDAYPQEMQRRLRALRALTIIQDEVQDLVLTADRVEGVRGAQQVLYAPRVVITAGTFLAAVMHRGDERTPGGRVGDVAAKALARTLEQIGLRLGRLKTGTVPRLDATTIDWSRTVLQTDTAPGEQFSFRPRTSPMLRQIDCYMTHTNERVHAIIRRNLHLSPMYTGAIKGRGPRYCPSLEDKVARFPDRDRHLLFLEPEGLKTRRIYANGISTSLPQSAQDEFLREIEGLEHAKVLQYGYAVEYDFVDPTQLGHDLQLTQVRGLHFAGQVNGTSGYEEAAAQGLIAGVCAARGDTLRLGRGDAYIGVLIDDLVTRGVGGEPYRMFTSRAEHRLVLREDNADRRLMPIAQSLGLLERDVWQRFEAKRRSITEIRELFEGTTVNPSGPVLDALSTMGLGPLRSPATAAQLLRRPEARWQQLWPLVSQAACSNPEAAGQVEIDVKYQGYIERASRRAHHASQLDGARIPPDVDWSAVRAISTEARERLSRARPTTLGQASRLPGITPASINAIASWLGRQRCDGDL